MDQHERELVDELFTAVEVDPANAVIAAAEEQLLDVGVGGEVTLIVRGRALELLREVQERLAQSALAAGGPAPATLEQLLLAACREAHASGPAAGVAFLATELAKPRRTWRIFDPINVAFPGDHIVIGQCALYQQLPADVPRDVLASSGISGEFAGRTCHPYKKARWYESVRSEPTWFGSSGSPHPEIERVIGQYDGFTVVEKNNGQEFTCCRAQPAHRPPDLGPGPSFWLLPRDDPLPAPSRGAAVVGMTI